MVRGKKRIGYEIKIKLRFEGVNKMKGVEVEFKFKDICDDGSEPESTFKITKDTKLQAGVQLKKDIRAENTQQVILEKVKEVLNQLKEEA